MRKNLFYMSLLASMAFAFTACSDDDSDDMESLGNENEACMEGNVCNGDLVCVNNVCKAKSGAADGAEGGKCLADNKCNGDLVCENDVCKAKSGAADGAEGGKCLADNKCNGDLVCENDVCKAKSGPADGAEGGACKSDGSCDKYLACDANVCKPIDDGKAGGKCGGEVKCDKYLNCNVDVCEAIADGAEGGKCKADNACDGELLCKDDVCVAPGPGDKNQVCREDGYCNGSLVCSPDDSGNAKCVEAAAIVEELVKSDELINKVQICILTEPEDEKPVLRSPEENDVDAKTILETFRGWLVDDSVACSNYLNQPIMDAFNDMAALDESTCTKEDLEKTELLKMKLEGVVLPSVDYFSCIKKQDDFDLDEYFDRLIKMVCDRMESIMGRGTEECINNVEDKLNRMLISDEAVCASQYNDSVKLSSLLEYSVQIEMFNRLTECQNNAENDYKKCDEACGPDNDPCSAKCLDAKENNIDNICEYDAGAYVYSKLGVVPSEISWVPVEYAMCLRDSDAELSEKAKSLFEISCRMGGNSEQASIDSCVDVIMESIADSSKSELCADEYQDYMLWQGMLSYEGSDFVYSLALDNYTQWWKENADSVFINNFEIYFSNTMIDLVKKYEGKYQACLNDIPDQAAVASYVLNQLCGNSDDDIRWIVSTKLMFELGVYAFENRCSKAAVEAFLPKEDSACADQMISYIINVFPVLAEEDFIRELNVIQTEDYKNMMACVDSEVKSLFDDEQYKTLKENYAKIADTYLKSSSEEIGMSFDTEAVDYPLYFMYNDFLYEVFLLMNRGKDDACVKPYAECGVKYSECFLEVSGDYEKVWACESNMDICKENVLDGSSCNGSSDKLED